MIFEIVLAVVGFMYMSCEKDDSKTNAKNALIVAILFAVIHCGCILWIQRQVLANIVKDMDKEFEEKNIPQAEREYDITDGYSAKVRKATCEVIKYDFLFLFYFIFVPAAWCFAMYGMSLVPKCTNDDAYAASGCFLVLLLYNCGNMLFFLFLMCGIACGAGKDKAHKRVKTGKAVVSVLGKVAKARGGS